MRGRVIVRSYSDAEVRALYNDPRHVDLRWLYQNYRTVFEEIERAAVRMGLTTLTQSGPRPAERRAVTWEDTPFRGF